MSAWRRLFRRRPYALSLAGALLALLAGDRAQMAPPPGMGIDPFEVLDQQVRNNVLIVFDTSGSMKWPVDRDNFTMGADDPGSRMYQAKQAVKAVVAANQNRVNFGLVTYNALKTDKNLNETQDFENDGRVDGPFVYVTADGAAAAPFYNPFTSPDDAATPESEACNNVDGFFCRISNTFANYDGANSGDVWRSFMNRGGNNQGNAYNNAYPAGCVNDVGQLTPINLAAPASMRCRYYMQSRLLRNGVRYTWSLTNNLAVGSKLLATATDIACPAPPAGLLGTAFTPPCFQMQAGNNGPISTFYYTSAIFQQQSGSACGGGALITSIAACDQNNAPQVLAEMDPEIPITPAGQLNGVPAPPGTSTFDYGDGHLDGDQPTPFGLRADQSTPLAGTLDFIRTSNTPAPPFPPQVVRAQKNFVILVTDGDDTCADSGNTDHSAVLAAAAAERLFMMFNPRTQAGDFQHWAETMVVGFASAVNPARVNVIAQAGSGFDIDETASTPALAMSQGRCRTDRPAACRNAFFASSTQQLIDILNAALEQASLSGVFSATPSVFDGVPEFVNLVPAPASPAPPVPFPFDVMDPDSRFKAQPFRSYRALFDAANFRGLVRGFDEFGPMVAGTRPSPAPTYPRTWEAGQRLIDPDRMSPDLDPTTGTDHTFGQLLVASSPPFPPGDDLAHPHIHRRIFTTKENGRQLGSADDMAGATFCSGGPCRVNLWPPDTNVAPGGPGFTDYSTPGILDSRLFRKDDGTQMTLPDLQAAPLKACLGAPLPTPCTSGTASVVLAAARKEAREMILAFTAGAEPRRDASGNPARDASGQIVYRRRAWALAESTVSTPALVTQPVNLVPTVHTQEYLLYRDGPRDLPSGQASGGNSDTFIRQGFGLRNPDRDGKESPVGTLTRPALKPSMSVLFLPANDMLHAFRAGPCPAGVTACGGGTPQAESGGEELWAFVPHDLLFHLKEKMKAQVRNPHTYMLSASLRFADVFLPGRRTLTVSGRTYDLEGRWRRVLMFGRGPGGKYYTTLDITGLGSLTNPVLQTQLPAVLWNRGNPDTDDGLTTGRRNGSNTEYTQYLDMGQTWSTPAVVRVNGTPEFVAYVGSGFADPATNVNEGTRFYTLDPFSGDIVTSADVGEGAQTAFQNALVANPVVYAGALLKPGVDLPHPATPVNESVFIGDIHGRLWKFLSNSPGTRQLFRDLGTDQPIGEAAALLNINAPFVFVETGRDFRVPAPSDGFKMFGFKDTGPPYPTGVVTLPVALPDFGLAFPPPPAQKGDYRGTLQPVTAFQKTSNKGLVFFVGTRFNPVTSGRCVSSFDTIIFGLFGETGGVAYATTEYEGVKAVGVPRPPVPSGAGEPPPVDQGTGLDGAEPTACKNCPPAARPGQPSIVRAESLRTGSPVCR